MLVQTASVIAATLAILRLRARRRGDRLSEIMAREGATWAALCRVTSGGEFLDHSRSRRGGGPRGVLVHVGDTLYYRPDRYERKHGDVMVSLSLDEVSCPSRRYRRDISGLRFVEARLVVPQGTAVVAIFHQVGQPPLLLARP